MSYYNRREQLLKTLYSISLSVMNKENIEIIIVDDCSDNEHKITDLNKGIFGLTIKVIEVKKEDKWWINPCVPFNMGFKETSGDIVVIQNPECIHFGDCLTIINENIKDNTYINFACYSINQGTTEKILKLDNNSNILINIESIISPMYNGYVLETGDNGWYNHKIFRPVFYHFLSAMYKKDLYDLNGFDARYAEGISFDDNEFLRRIIRKNMRVNIVNYPFVIHQWHYTGNNNIDSSRAAQLVRKNENLYNNITMQEKTFKANKGIV